MATLTALGRERPQEGRVTTFFREMATGNKALNWWGLITLLLYFAAFPYPVGDRVNLVLRLLAITNGAFFGVIALMFTRTVVRVPAAIALLLVLQVWSAISYFIGMQMTARQDLIGSQMYYLLEQLLPYFTTYLLIKVKPKFAAIVVNILLAYITLSAVVALYQFSGLPGSKATLTFFYDITRVDPLATDTVRASGITGHPGILAFQMLLGIAIILGRLENSVRKLDVTLGVIFILGLLVAQVRSVLLAFFLVILVGSVLLWKKRKSIVLSGVGLLALLLTAGLIFVPERLGYIFEQTNPLATLQYRQDVYAGVLNATQDLRMWGTGPEASLLGTEGAFTGRGFRHVENAYIGTFIMLGYPGLAILLAVFVAGLLSALRLLIHRARPELKAAGLIALCLAITYIVIAFVSEIFGINTGQQMAAMLIAVVVTQVESVLRASRPARREPQRRVRIASQL